MFFENIIFNHQRVFHKELSTQQCLLAIPKKYIKSPLIGVKQNLALMDVAYLLLELFMIIHQIKNNNERNNWSYTELLGIVSGVPQGLDFGQVLFNTYLADIYTVRYCKRYRWGCSFWRCGYPEVFLGKDVLKIRIKFTGENPCQSVIWIKLQSNFIEITLRHGCFPVHLLHIFRIPFLKFTSGGLLLRLAEVFYRSLCKTWLN